jgi:hypothetical protein
MTKHVTAAELLAQLEKDPAFVARRNDQERRRQANAEALRAEESPLISELEAAGYEVGSVWDLANSESDYRDLVPLLLSHLARPYASAIREGIARALGIPGAIGQWAILRDRYEAETDPRVKDGLAAALSAVADDSVIASVIGLARDPNNGASRVLLLRALAKSRAAEAREALMSSRNDPLLAQEASFLLRTSKKI